MLQKFDNNFDIRDKIIAGLEKENKIQWELIKEQKIMMKTLEDQAFLFLLNNECCTSFDKSRKFLSDLTGGQLNISKGMINNLSEEFAKKVREGAKNNVCAYVAVSNPAYRLHECKGKRKKCICIYMCNTRRESHVLCPREKRA